MSSRARRNPFHRESIIHALPPAVSPLEAPPIPPKILEDDYEDTFSALQVSIDINVTETAQLEVVSEQSQHVADGYSEYTQSFGSLALAQSSSNIRTPCDFLLPVKAPVECSEVEVSRSSDKEVVPDNCDNWTLVLPIREDVSAGANLPLPAVSPSSTIPGPERDELLHNCSDFEAVSPSSNVPGPGSDELFHYDNDLEVSSTPTRWDANDFGPLCSSHYNSTTTESVSDQRQVVPLAVAAGVHQKHKPIPTAESDLLAMQRLKTLTASKSMLQKRNSTVRTTLRLVRKKTALFKHKLADPDEAGSGYLYTTLAEALQDAVAEETSHSSPLYSISGRTSTTPRLRIEYITISCNMAVAFGHSEIVDYFIAKGADGASVDNALITAFFADRFDLTTKLAPHANI